MTKDQEDLCVYLGALCFGLPESETIKIIEFRDKILHKLERLDKYENILGKNKLTYKEEWLDDCGHKHYYFSKDNACLDKLGELEDIYENK